MTRRLQTVTRLSERPEATTRSLLAMARLADSVFITARKHDSMRRLRRKIP